MKYSKEIYKKVVLLYKKGLEIKEICKVVGVGAHYCNTVARKENILRGSGRKSIIPIEKFYPNTPEGSYWLGYIISDGCISYNPPKRIYEVAITTIDKEIKDKLKDYIPEINIYESFLNNKPLYTLYFGSIRIVEYLVSIGITPRKSKTIDLSIPLNKHIIRGIFDGDGSYHNKKCHAKITTGSLQLGEEIVKFLKSQNIFSKLRKRKNEDCYDVWIERKNELLKFKDLLYKDTSSNIYMERKYQKVVALLSNK